MDSSCEDYYVINSFFVGDSYEHEVNKFSLEVKILY